MGLGICAGKALTRGPLAIPAALRQNPVDVAESLVPPAARRKAVTSLAPPCRGS
jgi:hypothetical protein